jgi:hypothetical protein
MNPTRPKNSVKTAMSIIHVLLDEPMETNAAWSFDVASTIAQIEVPRNTTTRETRAMNTWITQLS